MLSERLAAMDNFFVSLHERRERGKAGVPENACVTCLYVISGMGDVTYGENIRLGSMLCSYWTKCHIFS
jgi:hypothetical protein